MNSIRKRKEDKIKKVWVRGGGREMKRIREGGGRWMQSLIIKRETDLRKL